MRLQTFRIRYCFGFVDSGEVDLREPNNLVWILGRNSSGKSSMLSSLEQLASGKRPDQHPRFANFDPPPDGRYGKLEAKFSVAVGELSIRPVIQRVLDSFAGVPVDIDEVDGRFTAPAQLEVDAVLVAVQDGYQALLSATEEAGEVRIVKDYDPEYFLFPAADDGNKLRDARLRSIKDALTQGGRGSAASRPTDQWVVDNTAYPFTLSFVDLEEAFYLQFPNGEIRRIYLLRGWVNRPQEGGRRKCGGVSVLRYSSSSGVEARPSISLRCGWRPKRAITWRAALA